MTMLLLLFENTVINIYFSIGTGLGMVETLEAKYIFLVRRSLSSVGMASYNLIFS